MKTKYSLKFASWFTGTCLCTVEHPKYGKHQLTTHQIKYSDGDYKNKLYQAIENAKKQGQI